MSLPDKPQEFLKVNYIPDPENPGYVMLHRADLDTNDSVVCKCSINGRYYEGTVIYHDGHRMSVTFSDYVGMSDAEMWACLLVDEKALMNMLSTAATSDLPEADSMKKAVTDILTLREQAKTASNFRIVSEPNIMAKPSQMEALLPKSVTNANTN